MALSASWRSMKPFHFLMVFIGFASVVLTLQGLVGILKYATCSQVSELSSWPHSKSSFYEGSWLATSFGGALGTGNPLLRVYMYDLPERFNHEVVKAYWRQRSSKTEGNANAHGYPNYQHSAEWHLYRSLLGGKDAPGRKNPTAIRVSDPEDADVFFVPFFSSLSLKVDPLSDGHLAGEARDYSNYETCEALVAWLQKQPAWQRSRGRDHVLPAQHPNALHGFHGKFRNTLFLVSDFARVGPLDSSLAKDVVLPYVHRVQALEPGTDATGRRQTLLFFMGGKHRKKGGLIRKQLFDVLEGEKDVVMAEGRQGGQGYRAAQEGMRSSRFCLHPEGDTPSGGRLFDAIVSACVPVIISDRIELPFEGLLNYSEFSIFVPAAQAIEPGRLVKQLRAVSAEQLRSMQEALVRVKEHFTYDAADGAVNMVWRAVAGKVPWMKEQIARDRRMVAGGLRSCRCQCMEREDDLCLSSDNDGSGARNLQEGGKGNQ